MGSTVFKLQRWFIIKIKIRNCKNGFLTSSAKCKIQNSILVFFPILLQCCSQQASQSTYSDRHFILMARWHPTSIYPPPPPPTQQLPSHCTHDTASHGRSVSVHQEDNIQKNISIYVQKYFTMRSKTISNEPSLPCSIHHWAVCRCKEALIVAAATGHGASTNHLK